MAPDGVLESIGGPGLLLRGVAGAAVRVLGAVVVAAVWGWVGRFGGPAWGWLGSVCLASDFVGRLSVFLFCGFGRRCAAFFVFAAVYRCVASSLRRRRNSWWR